MSRGYLPGALLAALLAGGCAVYHPKPLNDRTIGETLAPPDLSALAVAADSLKHPMMTPLKVDLGDGLSPDEAAVLAVLANPALRQVRDSRDLAEAQVVQAHVLPNPTFDYSLDTPTGGVTAGAIKAYGLGVGWDISELISHIPQVKAAKANRRSVELDVAWQEWQTAQAAKIAVWRLVTLNRQIDLANETDQNLADNLKLVRKAVQEGVMTELDRAAAETASNEAHAKLLDLQRQANEQNFRLDRWLGLPPTQTLPLQQKLELPESYSPPPMDSLTHGVEQRRLDLTALRFGYQSQDETLRAAILAQFPKINIGVNKARDTGDVITTGFGISVDLPLFDRNQGEVAVQRATRKLLFDEYTNRVFETVSDIAILLNTIESLNAQIATAEQAEPSLGKLVTTYRDAVSQGQADILSYYTAWSNWTDKRIEVLSLKQELMEARIGLEIASGRYSLDGSGSASSRSRHDMGK